MKKDPIVWQKHLEACRKWRENNRERFRQISLTSYYKKKAENPEKYLKIRTETAKRYRLRNLDECKIKEKEKSRLRRLNNYKEDFKYMKKYLREYALKKVYNITVEDYKKMLLEQAGKCAICSEKFDKTPQTDHCHDTQKVRGLLCWPCNVMLGMIEKGLKRNGELLSRVTEYLK
jgi:hypothetical protein